MTTTVTTFFGPRLFVVLIMFVVCYVAWPTGLEAVYFGNFDVGVFGWGIVGKR